MSNHRLLLQAPKRLRAKVPARIRPRRPLAVLKQRPSSRLEVARLPKLLPDLVPQSLHRPIQEAMAKQRELTPRQTKVLKATEWEAATARHLRVRRSSGPHRSSQARMGQTRIRSLSIHTSRSAMMNSTSMWATRSSSYPKPRVGGSCSVTRLEKASATLKRSKARIILER